jgi:hypothetical protein
VRERVGQGRDGPVARVVHGGGVVRRRRVGGHDPNGSTARVRGCLPARAPALTHPAPVIFNRNMYNLSVE